MGQQPGHPNSPHVPTNGGMPKAAEIMEGGIEADAAPLSFSEAHLALVARLKMILESTADKHLIQSKEMVKVQTFCVSRSRML